MRIGASYGGPFWHYPESNLRRFEELDGATRSAVLKSAAEIRSGRLTYFSSMVREVGFPPDWRRDPTTGREWSLDHWTQISDFGAGDIKQIWEASRFDALPVLAAAVVLQEKAGDRQEASNAVENWMSSWIAANPLNAGPNWRCGQESALRLVNTLVADSLLRTSGASHHPALERFVSEHCLRVASTTLYAIAQDNNHATSEAVALYIGGQWLSRYAANKSLRVRASRWQRIGYRNFTRSVRRLVLADGTFSQYSVNYHRLFLDTASLFELFRLQNRGAPLGADVRERLAQAARWLVFFTDPRSGDAPNIGANDGSRLLQVAGVGYRDFRPHGQLAAALFCDAHAWRGVPSADAFLRWFGVPTPASLLPQPTSKLFPEGGYAVLVRGELRAYVRLPVHRFRPSQSDLLHVDIWWRGRNVVRDGGTFSYNCEQRWMMYFSGVSSHSTVQFDTRDQMPRLSRFLLGRWPAVKRLEFDSAADSIICSYCDYRGAVHQRRIAFVDDSVVIEDEVEVSREGDLPAVSRLRLEPAPWSVQGDNSYIADGVRVRGSADGTTPVLVDGFESRCYFHLSSLPVIQLTMAKLPARACWRLQFS